MRMIETPTCRSPARIARWIGAAPRQRGSKRSVNVHGAERGGLEDGRRENQPVRRHTDDVGGKRLELRHGLGVSQRGRLAHAEAEFGRGELHRGRTSALPRPDTASGRT